MSTFNVIREECYKIFIKKHFIWVFLAVFIVQIFQFGSMPNPTSFHNTASEVIYQENINELRGAYDEKKAKVVLEAAEYTFDYKKKIDGITNDPAEYLALLSKFPSLYESIPVYTMLKSQVEYVQENPIHRYYLDASGWEVLLTDSNFDYVFIFLVIIMASAVYANEYESNVDIMNRSSYLGRAKRYFLQTVVIIVSLTILFISVNIVRYIMLHESIMFTGKFPIQSIPSFANTFINMSINQTFIVLIIIRIMGIIYIVSLISFVTQRFKNALLSVFIGGVIVLLPFIVLKPFELYAFPLPTTWFMGTGLIQGPSIVPYMAAVTRIKSVRDFGIITIKSILIIVLIWRITLNNLRKGY